MSSSTEFSTDGRETAIVEDRPSRRLSTETKASFKTTEFFAYIGAVVGVLLASQLIGTEDGHDDYFRADRAWFYIVLLTIATWSPAASPSRVAGTTTTPARKSAGFGCSPARENTAAAARPGPSLVACGQSDGGPVHRTGSDPQPPPREVR